MAIVASVVFGSASPARAQPTPAPAADAVGAVQDIVGEIQSLDGTESETRRDTTVTLALTSDVLFAFDKAEVTAKARQRLQEVADQITAEGAGGLVRIEGHTDDQGSDSYNDRLSQRRAQAIRVVLAALLAGRNVMLQARGYGERRPKVPNFVDGKPNERNRAINRRVEIIFTIKR